MSRPELRRSPFLLLPLLILFASTALADGFEVRLDRALAAGDSATVSWIPAGQMTPTCSAILTGPHPSGDRWIDLVCSEHDGQIESLGKGGSRIVVFLDHGTVYIRALRVSSGAESREVHEFMTTNDGARQCVDEGSKVADRCYGALMLWSREWGAEGCLTARVYPDRREIPATDCKHVFGD